MIATLNHRGPDDSGIGGGWLYGKYYEQKRVEVFYAVEGDLMVTATVYVFYGKWEVCDERFIQ